METTLKLNIAEFLAEYFTSLRLVIVWFVLF